MATLSENAEYDAAKERQGFLEGRIKEIEGKLGNAQIIDPASLDADGRVVFGSTVELEDMDSGGTVTYQIVGDDEADIKASKISLNSPVARALIGKFAGDVAEVQTPGGQARIRDPRRQVRLMRFWGALYSLGISIWVGGMLAIGYLAAPDPVCPAVGSHAGRQPGRRHVFGDRLGRHRLRHVSAALPAGAKGWRAVQSACSGSC
jgi:transcription elongation GreA/GreB family factor